MSQYTPLEFQQRAIESLISQFKTLWQNTERQIEIVFKSPTGSGKTFVTTSFINQLNNQPDWDFDKCFVWITFSDDLAMQSKEKFYDYFFPNISNRLLTVNDFSNGKLKKNDILFINWQKLVSRKAEDRRIRRPNDVKSLKEQGYYFEDIVESTQNENREIIMIIDESQKNVTDAAQRDVIGKINPKIIIKVSATPENEPTISDITHNRKGFVEVDREDVVDENLIKERILCQTEEDLLKHKEENLDEVLLKLAIEKREEIKNEYDRLNKKINPLVLIQLPNDDKIQIEQGLLTKEQIVTNYLLNQGIEEKKIAYWFDGRKENMLNISDNDNEVEYMLFKQAAGTGWDCPRACVLVMYREINSPTFYTQTLGRILRIADPKDKETFKKSPLLRTGFLFTNYKRNEVNIPDQSNKNKPFVYTTESKYGEITINQHLKTNFISRVDYGDLVDSVKFQRSLVNTFDNFFGFSTEIMSPEEKHNKIKERGIEIKTHLTNKIIVDAEFKDFDNINKEINTQGKDAEFEVSNNDVEKTFTLLCSQLLAEQTEEDAKITNIARSWSPLKSALRVWLFNSLCYDGNTCYKVFINDILRGTDSIFRRAITKSLKDYRPILNSLMKEREEKLNEPEVFKIKQSYSFTDDYEIYDTKLCVLKEFYIEKEYIGKQNEIEFIDFLEQKGGKIEWWFKNGDYGKDYFAIKYTNTNEGKEKLFYPDWIVKFKDNRIGIFDTKGGQTATSKETKDKAEALIKYIKELNKIGGIENEFIGGIVVKANAQWYFNDNEEYNYNQNNLNEWKPIIDCF